jgi:hypothetical protein
MIKRINPTPPLGQYPQPELYGHAGSAPISSRIKTISKIVLMLLLSRTTFVLVTDFGRQRTYKENALMRLSRESVKESRYRLSNFLGDDANCVFSRFNAATGSIRIDLCEFGAKKQNLR